MADKDREAHVANAMLAEMDSHNIVHEVIQEFSQEDLNEFALIDENSFDFPRIEKDDLPQITLGTYQLRQARSYAHQHQKAKMPRFEVPHACFVCPEDITRTAFANIIIEKNVIKPVLVNTQMDSRFRSKKWHDSFILADASKIGPDAIIGYCCEFRHGLRTVGCCSHVATTIYYLCHARHHGGIKPVASYVDNFFDSVQIADDDDAEVDREE